MQLATRFLPIGELPYDSVRLVTAMEAKIFKDFPFIAVLPQISKENTIERRTLINIPGIEFDEENNIVLKTGTSEFREGLLQLEKAIANPSSENLESYRFDADFAEKFFQMIKKFHSKNACVSLLGPFTLSQIISNCAEEQHIADKKYKKLYTEAVCVKGLWIINKIKEYCPDTVPVIILEEPMYGQFGTLKRNNDRLSSKHVIDMFETVIKNLKSAGAIVGISCMDKCDWSLPIRSGVDIISYDAYNNPNNLCIIPELVTSFLEKGGMINWGIIPLLTESMVKGLTIDYLLNRLIFTMQGLMLSGVPQKLLQKSALVSPNGSTNHLPVFFAEKAFLLGTKLAAQLASTSNIFENSIIINDNRVSYKRMRH